MKRTILISTVFLCIGLLARGQTETEPNNSLGQANPLAELATISGEVGNNCTIADNSSDFFIITPPVRGTMILRTSISNDGPTDGLVSVDVLNNGAGLDADFDAQSGGNNIAIDDSITIFCQGAGTYYIRVSSGGSSLCTQYSLSYEMVAPLYTDDAESNNSTGLADTVLSGIDHEGTINFQYGDNSDFYRLILPDDGQLNLSVDAEHADTSTSDSLTISLLNNGGGLITSWRAAIGANSIPASNLFNLECRGTENLYYLRFVSDVCGTSYRFNYNVTPPVFAEDDETVANGNDGTTTADTIAVDSLVEGRLNFFYDDNFDYYRLVLDDDGILNVEVEAEHTSSSTSDSLTVVLLNDGAGFITSWRAAIGANSVPAISDLNIDCRGSERLYYMYLTSDACGTSYRFKYNTTSPVFNDDDETGDGNDSFGAADTVMVDSLVEGRLNFFYDDNADYYRLILDDDGTLNINTLAEQVSSSSTDSLTLRLLNNGAGLITSWRVPVGANSTPASGNVSFDCLGTEFMYVLQVESDACGASYQFNYNVTPPVYAEDAEFGDGNDAFGTADTVAVDSLIQGRLNFTYDDNFDYYRLILDDDGILNISSLAEHASASTTDSLTLTLLNNGAGFVTSWRVPVGALSSPAGATVSIDCRGNENMYVLQVQADACGASYQLSYDVTPPVFADDVEDNDGFGTSIPIDLEASSVEGRLNFFYDDNSDFYQVELLVDTTITINSRAENSNSGGTYNIDILNAGGGFVEGHTLPVGGASTPAIGSFTSSSLTAGIYYLRVQQAPCGTSYSFDCYDDDNDGTCNFFDLCPGGPEPGTPCDDLDVCTTGDVIQADCSCAGVFQDTDNDGTCDANDVCPGGPEPGTPCDDLDASTGNDVILADCSCAGQLIDCLGVPGGTALPGTPCDDGDPTTGGDVYQADCSCAGSTVDCNGVPGGPDVPGAPCDDGDPNTGNDVYQADCSCSGQLIDCLGVPGGTALPGTPCDDGDPTTGGDVYQADCSCAGSTVDCNGVPGGPDVPGAPCDDGDPNTGNDVYQADCSCSGQLIDCEGLPGGTDLPGAPCDDGDPTTGNDVYQADCSCSGQLIDCEGVPGGTDLPGASCDDGNPNTTGDVYQADCSCEGIPTGSGNNVTLHVQADNNGSETSFEIVAAGTSTVLCSRTGFPSNTVTVETCNLPDGCYELRVFDSMGDGMFTGINGGYILYDQFGEAIINNDMDGQFTSVSAIINNNAFCLPLGTDRLRFADCGNTELRPTDFIVAETNTAVSNEFGVGDQTDDGFQYWIYDPDGTYSRYIFLSHANPMPGSPPGAWAVNHLRISGIYTLPVPSFVNLNCRIRARVNGTYSSFGPACIIRVDPLAAGCPTTKLIDDPTNSKFSCGVAKTFGGSDKIYADPRPGANRYQFRFRIPSEGFQRFIAVPSYTLKLRWGTLPLQVGKTYETDVRISYDGGANYCPFGDVCDVTIVAPSAFQASGRSTTTGADELELTVYPNPNRGEAISMVVSSTDELRNPAVYTITDLTGKEVHQGSFRMSGPEHREVIALDMDMKAGTYLIVVTVGDQTVVQRLVKH